MSIAEYAIKKPTNTWMFIILMLAGGLLAYRDMARLEDPVFTIKDAKIYTNYPGASPEEVELEVTDRLEEAILQMKQVKEIESTSSRGFSEIEVTMKDKYDKNLLPQVWDELRRKVNDAQGDLPPGTSPSIVNDDFGDVYGILYAVTGEGFSYHELKDFVDELQKHLSVVQGVSKVTIAGNHEEVIYVELSRARMARLGISPHQIYRTLEEQNAVLDAGGVKVGPEFITVEPSGAFSTVEAIGSLLIRGAQADKVITLSDVADVTRSYASVPKHLVRHNGVPAIMVGVSALEGTNVVAVGQGIDRALEGFLARTPIGIQINPVFEQPKIVQQAVGGFILSVAQALLIVFTVLWIFMGLRSATLIGLTLLLNVVGTMAAMEMLGLDLQRISLGALIIALGMLVDNAIVVTEGILVRVERGEPHLTAAGAVVGQTMVPLLGATVVGFMAFAGIGLSQDLTGEYCRSLFYVILVSLLLSWLLAVYVVPLLSTYLLKLGTLSEEASEDNAFYRGYSSLLRLVLRQRLVMLLVLVGMMALAVVGFGQLKGGFFPDSSTPIFFTHFWLPEGTDVRTTEAELMKLGAHVGQMENVESVTAFIGQGAHRFTLTYGPESQYASYGMLFVKVAQTADLNPTMEKVRAHVRQGYPDAAAVLRKIGLGPTNDYRIEARFTGADPVVLRDLASQAMEIMRAQPDATGVRLDWREPVKVLQPVYSDAAARHTGVTRRDLANALASGFEGATVGLFREGVRLLSVVTRPTAAEREDAGSISAIQVWSPNQGKNVPIDQVVSEFRTGWENARIVRRDRQRTVTAQSNGWAGSDNALQQRVKGPIEALALPPGYALEWGGDLESASDAQGALFSNLPGTFLIMIVIVVLLFGQWRQPLIIWLCVPMGLIGVTLGLYATDLAFDFMALLGFLSLAGMLIMNGVVLINQIDLEIHEGKPPLEAIVDSAKSRVRPVAMTAITTVLGVVPLLADDFFVSMSVLIMAGLSFGTVLTLLAVPLLYAVLFRIPYRTAEEG